MLDILRDEEYKKFREVLKMALDECLPDRLYEGEERRQRPDPIFMNNHERRGNIFFYET